jgi:hypothetical protein
VRLLNLQHELEKQMKIKTIQAKTKMKTLPLGKTIF